jgi:beta-N-acetylhexosaminidase
MLIDQEGGRVARLKPPKWRSAPAAARFGELAGDDLDAAREAARLNARLIAADLYDLGISVNCVPVLDVLAPGATTAIGDRAFGGDPEIVARLGAEVCAGMLAGGVLPVIKHMPGHGRARVDSHKEPPLVDASLAALRDSDFAPFKALAGTAWGMTSHVIYTAIDDVPATVSSRVIGEIVRGEIGFEGVLVSDDLSMEALRGRLGARAAAALAAGCDVVEHCNGRRDEMREVAGAVRSLDDAACARIATAEASRHSPEPFDHAEARVRLDALLAGNQGS